MLLKAYSVTDSHSNSNTNLMGYCYLFLSVSFYTQEAIYRQKWNFIMKSNLTWELQFDPKAHNQLTKLTAKLDTSPYWFTPKRMKWNSMTLETFRNHLRKLARHYHASHIIIRETTEEDEETIVYFHRDYLFREKYLEDTDQNENNIVYDFYQIKKEEGIILPYYVFLYSNQLFPTMKKE